MKLHLANAGQQNVISGYGEGYVQINHTRHFTSILVGAERLAAWPVANIRDLTPTHLQPIFDTPPEVLIIGTGKRFHFPPPAALRPLLEARIGHEVMDTPAACRTYNVLLGEGRRVTAVLVVD